jgi:NADPH2:quinone reductase
MTHTTPTTPDGSMQAWTSAEGVPLQRATLPIPVPQDEQLLIRVRAAALNNGDLTAAGEEHVAGFEFAGEVVAVGATAPADLLGRRVFGIAEGTLAEYVVAHHRHVLVTPDALSDIDAAATPTAFTTEFGAAETAAIGEGSTVLVTGGSSALGLVAVQVAKERGARRVLATTRSEDKIRALADAGADAVLLTANDGIAAAALEATDGVGTDVVLDHLGGDALDSAVAAARDGGTVVSVGRLAGGTGALDLFALARRHVLLRSVSYGLTPPEVLGDLLDGLARTLLPAIVAGRVRPVVVAAYDFERAPDALEHLRTGRSAGKIVVTLG